MNLPPHPFNFVAENFAEVESIRVRTQFGSPMIYARGKIYFGLYRRRDENFGLWVATDQIHWPKFEAFPMRPNPYLPNWLILPVVDNFEEIGVELCSWAQDNKAWMGRVTKGSSRMF